MTITLSGSGTGFDPDKAFTVNVAFGSAISYTVDGVPVQAPSASYTASLKSGESVVLGNIPFGTTYSVTEQALPSTDIEDGYSTGAVVGGSGTMTDAGAPTATAAYSYSAPAQLTVQVAVSGSGYNPGRAFPFTVEFSSPVRYYVNGTPISEASTTYSGALLPGQSVVLGKIPAGITYSVTEGSVPSAYGYSNASVTNGSGTFSPGDAITAVATYAYTAPANNGIIRLTSDSAGVSGVVHLSFSSYCEYTVNGAHAGLADEADLSISPGETIELANVYGGSFWLTATVGTAGSVSAHWYNTGGLPETSTFSPNASGVVSKARMGVYPPGPYLDHAAEVTLYFRS